MGLFGVFFLFLFSGESALSFSLNKAQLCAADVLPQLCPQKSVDLLLPPVLLEVMGLNVSLCCSLQLSDVRVGAVLSPPRCSSSSAFGQAK